MARRDSQRIDEPEDPPGHELVIPERHFEQMLAEQSVARAREEGIDLVGPDVFSTRVTTSVLGAVLDIEMTDH